MPKVAQSTPKPGSGPRNGSYAQVAASEGSNLEREFDYWWGVFGKGIEAPEHEYQFNVYRKWRIDRAWPAIGLAVELEGGVHRISSRFESDAEKYNQLSKEGWRIIRITSKMLKDDQEEVIRYVVSAVSDLEHRRKCRT